MNRKCFLFYTDIRKPVWFGCKFSCFKTVRILSFSSSLFTFITLLMQCHITFSAKRVTSNAWCHRKVFIGISSNLNLLFFSYQFNPQLHQTNVVIQILLKALMNLPRTDFYLCKCLIDENHTVSFLSYILFPLFHLMSNESYFSWLDYITAW